VEAAVQLQVLRREAQQIDIFRRGRQPAEAFIQIVAVLEERTAGAGGQFRQNIGAGNGRAERSASAAGIIRGIGIKPAGVQRADDHIGLDGALENVRLFLDVLRRKGVEAGRNKHDGALSRRDRHSLYEFLQIGERGEGSLLQIGERAGANHDAGPQAQQRVVQFGPVIREIQADLAGHGINRARSVGWRVAM